MYQDCYWLIAVSGLIKSLWVNNNEGDNRDDCYSPQNVKIKIWSFIHSK